MEQKDIELLNIKDFLAAIGISYCDIKPPINSNVCCVKRADSQWAAFKIGENQPVVPFGKYDYMWGFDNGYCLVSVHDNDSTIFANRGIIDSYGNEVVKPYTYLDIFSFYGKSASTILVLTYEGVPVRLPFSVLKLL